MKYIILSIFFADVSVASSDNLNDIASSYLKIPYREDGVLDTRGRYVTFRDQKRIYATPGLNCSGLLVDFSRRTLKKDITIAKAKYDRLGDSGPYAKKGEDWDFGRDLILNVSDGLPKHLVGPKDDIAGDGLPRRGFNLHDKDLWPEVLSQLRSGYVYFASISKPWSKVKPYKLIHYHVGIIIKQSDKLIWFYHTTKLSHTHRYNLAYDKGMEQFHYQFARSKYGDKYILLVGVEPPL